MINEAYLHFMESFKAYLNIISNGYDCIEKEPANILIKNIGRNITPIIGTSIEILESGEVTYNRVSIKTKKDEPDKTEEVFKTTKASLTRLLTQLFKDIDSPQKPNVIDALSRRLKSFVLNKNIEVKLVIGEGIKWCYHYVNTLETGSLGCSCMRSTRAQDYLDFYVNNPTKVALLVAFNNNIVMARRLIWRNDEGQICCDTIYSVSPEYSNILIDYCENTESRTKILDKIQVVDDIMTPEEDKILSSIWSKQLNKEWSNSCRGSVTMNIVGLEYMPYLDSYDCAYKRYDELIISAYDGDIRLNSDMGEVSFLCQDCDDGRVECTYCNGRNEEDCDTCGGTNDCPHCDGSKIEPDTESDDCTACGGSGECSICDGDTPECSRCEYNGWDECSYCWGSGSNLAYINEY